MFLGRSPHVFTPSRMVPTLLLSHSKSGVGHNPWKLWGRVKSRLSLVLAPSVSNPVSLQTFCLRHESKKYQKNKINEQVTCSDSRNWEYKYRTICDETLNIPTFVYSWTYVLVKSHHSSLLERLLYFLTGQRGWKCGHFTTEGIALWVESKCGRFH